MKEKGSRIVVVLVSETTTITTLWRGRYDEFWARQ